MDNNPDKTMKIDLLLILILTVSCHDLIAQSGSKYPYVTTNSDGKKNVIVCRDAKGGVPESRIHPNWTATEVRKTNLVAAKFEVALSDAAASASFAARLTACPAGWRVPTFRELMLIAALRTQLTAVSNTFSDGQYWAETHGTDTNVGMYANPITGYCCPLTQTNLDPTTRRIRCVRDLD